MSFKSPNIGNHLALTDCKRRLMLGLMILVSAVQLAAQEKPASDDFAKWFGAYPSNQYVTRLSIQPKDIERIRNNKHLFQFGIYYLSPQSLNSATPQLSIGFFSDPEKALKFSGAKQFSSSKGTLKIPQSEHAEVLRNYSAPNANSNMMLFYFKGKNREKNNKIILEQARALYVEGKYQQSLIVYLLLSVFAEDDIAAWSRELAGLSYEKQGALDQAIAHYRQIIKDYPASPGIQRVEQRLRALETAASNTQQPRIKPNNGKDSYGIFYRGALSQNYRNMTRSVNDGDSEEVLSILSNDYDLRASKRGDTHEFSFRVNGFLVQDEINEDEDYNRLRRAYVNYHHRPSGIDAVIGRQREFDSGVFTSFDGLTLSYQVREPFKLSVSTGTPVYFTPFYDDLDYNFVSVHGEIDIGKRWQLNTYVTQQTIDGITDREAVGFRASYAGKNLTSSLSLDYDTGFSELNSAVFNGFYRLGEKTNFTATYGQQRSPFLTASNVLIGRIDIGLEEYLRTPGTEDTLIQDALDRTSLSTYQTLSVSRALDENIDIILDYYQSSLSDIPSADFLFGDGLRTTASFDNQSYGLRVLAQQIFSKSDILNIGVKQGENDQGENTLVFLNERFRLGRRLAIQPKLSYLTIKFNNDEAEQQRTRYSLQFSFRPTRNTEFSLEAGDETVNTDDNQRSFNTRYYFGGFRVIF